MIKYARMNIKRLSNRRKGKKDASIGKAMKEKDLNFYETERGLMSTQKFEAGIEKALIVE